MREWLSSQAAGGYVDCLHDLGDPVGAARHVLASLNQDGHFMIIEPFANDDLADNLNPVGRVYYAGSTLLCTPCSRSQEVGLCLGRKPAKRASTRWSAPPASAAFDEPRRRRSTWSTKRGPETECRA